MDYKEKYEQALERAKEFMSNRGIKPDEDAFKCAKELSETIFPELCESEDEKIRKALVREFEENVERRFEWKEGIPNNAVLSWLEKQKERKTAIEAWKEIRFEVYAQASGNRHEPNYSDNNTKMFSLNDIDEIFEKISDCIVEQKLSHQMIAGAAKEAIFLEHKPIGWSEEDEKMANNLIEHFDWYADKRFTHSDCDRAISWLKSLKPQPKQEEIGWSQEDEEKLNKAAIEWNRNAYFSPIAMTLDSKGNPNGTKQFVTTHEASFKAGAKWVLNQYKFSKSSYWKPSEYDISLLEEIVRNIRNDIRPFCSEVSSLEDLIENIKKL